MVKMESIEGERTSKVKMEIRNVRKQSVYGLVLSDRKGPGHIQIALNWQWNPKPSPTAGELESNTSYMGLPAQGDATCESANELGNPRASILEMRRSDGKGWCRKTEEAEAMRARREGKIQKCSIQEPQREPSFHCRTIKFEGKERKIVAEIREAKLHSTSIRRRSAL